MTLFSKFIFKKVRTEPSFLIAALAATAFWSCSGGGGSPGLAYGGSAAGTMGIALKYVEYTDEAGKPILDRAQVDKTTNEMNAIYAACGISFRTEEYAAVNPGQYGLDYSLSDLGQLDTIRSNFDDPSKLLVVHTGPWNHGSVGAANAWTTMPGEPLGGAILESAVADFSAIAAHELGHYLGLDHVSDTGNLMNPIIYKNSTRLDPSQCEEMRDVAQSHRAAAIR